MGQGDQPVLLDVGEDAIARVRLNRPEASNGMNGELLQALHQAILRCHGDPAVRVVVLSGKGRHFCAGGNVRTFGAEGVAAFRERRPPVSPGARADVRRFSARPLLSTAVRGAAAGTMGGHRSGHISAWERISRAA